VIEMAKEKMTQAQAVEWIADHIGYTKKEVKLVLEGTKDLIQYQLGRGGPGEQILPILGMKVILRKVPKKPRRQVRNPATGEMIWADAKPASKKIVVRVMKALKDAVL
jgi:nucleoid DNA-binding protein